MDEANPDFRCVCETEEDCRSWIRSIIHLQIHSWDSLRAFHALQSLDTGFDPHAVVHFFPVIVRLLLRVICFVDPFSVGFYHHLRLNVFKVVRPMKGTPLFPPASFLTCFCSILPFLSDDPVSPEAIHKLRVNAFKTLLNLLNIVSVVHGETRNDCVVA